ncbi:SRPBCC domain-containing protein [Mesorhizobium sp. M0938]
MKLEPRIGGHFFEPWSDGVLEHRTTGTITEIDPPHLLAMTWKDEEWEFETALTVTIVGQSGGALISLQHRGWEGAPVEERAPLISDHRGGWSRHLKNLAACAESMTDRG